MSPDYLLQNSPTEINLQGRFFNRTFIFASVVYAWCKLVYKLVYEASF